MKTLVAYASSEGQTRKIARHVADRISELGHSAELISTKEAEGMDLDRFDRIILAASIHVGHYQGRFADFVAEQRDIIRNRPSLFLSVSLAAAGHDAEDWRALDKILKDFEAATGWTPDLTEQIAGAYLPSKYDVFRRFVMRRIVAKKDPDADLDADIEYTDWEALDALIDGWISDGA
ncbi:flavodoxin domain-containing protein [Thioclava electrotropha]|uniref:Protoporphyrinogen oxidase n=1 Tax=Thioclava electrotropha TaxID=1549850 RepID=A0ABX6YZE6_9RHOB|nr:flavodoxin domain-containing protein [Thioclava electrotropha]QPZ92639.1 protoporphyrinogen oxidase [Thioclava electrotropha]